MLRCCGALAIVSLTLAAAPAQAEDPDGIADDVALEPDSRPPPSIEPAFFLYTRPWQSGPCGRNTRSNPVQVPIARRYYATKYVGQGGWLQTRWKDYEEYAFESAVRYREC